MDPKKLQVLNARHLHNAIESEAGLDTLATEVRALLEVEFAEEKQGRLVFVFVLPVM